MLFWWDKLALLREAKKEASMAQKTWDTVCTLNDKLLGHIDTETLLLEEVKSAVASCPESSHIMIQNGILKRQGETLKDQGKELKHQGKTQMKILGVLMFCGLLLSFLLYAVFSLAEKKPIKPEAMVLEKQIEGD